MINGKTYYEVLGVSNNAEDIVIRSAYKALAQKYHPDKWTGPKDEATQKMQEINEAYSVLSNTEKRRAYDNEFKNSEFSEENSDYGDNESSDNNDQNEDWEIACKNFPDLRKISNDLKIISKRLSQTYQFIILSTKNYSQRYTIAENLELDFLKTFFGENREIINFAKELICEGKREAAKELNDDVRVMGKDLEPEIVIERISKKYNTERYRSTHTKNTSTNQKRNSKNIIEKNYLLITVALLVYSAIFLFNYIPDRNKNVIANNEALEKFTWTSESRKTRVSEIKSVRFINDNEVNYVPQPSDFSTGPKITSLGQNGKAIGLLADDHVWIDVAYPTEKNAIFAIISNRCAGNICSHVETYLLTINGKKLQKHFIGSNDIDIDVYLSNNELKSAIANVKYGEDSLGSKRKIKVEFHPNIGFVAAGVKKHYLPLITQYPFDYFENIEAREPLVKLIGHDKFRELRNYLDVSSGIFISDYKYIVLRGCMAHNCNSAFGAIIVDITNDDVWWIRVNDRFYESGGSSIESRDITSFKKFFEGIDIRDDAKLSLTDKGKLTVNPK